MSNLWDRVKLRFYFCQLTCSSLVFRPGVECVPYPSTLPKRLEAPELCSEFARYKKKKKKLTVALLLGVDGSYLLDS